MKQTSINFLKWLLGSAGREIVRIGFTLIGVYIFIKYGAARPSECDSVIPILNVKTNAAEVFGVILVFFTGLGVALAMKGGEALVKRFSK